MKKQTTFNSKWFGTHNDQILDQWMKSNQWFGDDLFLTNEALKIHIELEDKEKIDTDSQEYYNQIDTRIYNKHKRKLLKYFSHGN